MKKRKFASQSGHADLPARLKHAEDYPLLATSKTAPAFATTTKITLTNFDLTAT
jgi:hypothetical protein